MRMVLLLLAVSGCLERAPAPEVGSLPLAIGGPRIARCESGAICDPDGRGRCD